MASEGGGASLEALFPPFEVELARSGRVLRVPAEKSLLRVLIEAGGVRAWSDCMRGECGVCAIGVRGGQIDHRDSFLTEEQKQAGNIMCPCVSRAKSERLVLDL
jgi:ferredoxin